MRIALYLLPRARTALAEADADVATRTLGALGVELSRLKQLMKRAPSSALLAKLDAVKKEYDRQYEVAEAAQRRLTATRGTSPGA